MKEITILDGYTLNPGDLSWDEMNNLGNVAIYDRTTQSQILERCAKAQIILTNKVKIDRDTINQLQDLKYIGVLATGYNIVDVDAAHKRGIVVCNIPAYSTHSVAQLTFGLIIELAEDLSSHFKSVREGVWCNHSDFSYTTRTTNELADKTLGIIGYGQIAKQVIKIARAFEMNILVYTSHPDRNPDLHFVSKKELFSESDFVTIHTSLRPENEKIINRSNLELMKPCSYVINTSRGGLVDESVLAEFLNDERIAGAALDVLSQEPPNSDNPLLKAKNCLITPHIAWSTIEARQRLLDMAIMNIKAFWEGNPINVVN